MKRLREFGRPGDDMKKNADPISSPQKGKPRRLLTPRILWPVILLCVLVLAAALVLPGAFKGATALPAPGAMLTTARQGLDEITITAEFDPAASKLYAKQMLRLKNRTDAALADVVLRTYANAFSAEEYSPAAIEDIYDSCYPGGFSPGSIGFSQALINGGDADYVFSYDAKTVQRITVPNGLQPGEWIEISLEYTITIPECFYRFGHASGIYTLGNALPIPSVWEDGAWRTEDYFPLGDPFYSDCANYHVTVTTPAGYQCAGSAYGQRKEQNGKWVYDFDAPAVRDFALSISDKFSVAQEPVGNVLVSSYALSKGAAEAALKYGKQALQSFEKRYGEYPYQHLALTTVDFPFGGMEYPGIVLLQRTLYEDKGSQSLELTAVHEVAHQWWYAVVGSDEYYQSWQDEALAEFSLLDYTQDYYGQDARESLAYSRFETAMRATIPQGVTPGSPIDYFGNMSEYSLVVYRRGASLMVALNTALGDKFYDFLQAYYKKYAFHIATRDDFEKTLMEVSGQDWSALLTDYLDTYIVN